MTASDVSEILERRLASPLEGPFRRAVGLAFALHAAVAVSAWILPRLGAQPARPLEYVAVTIVPAAKLGIETPKPPPPAPVVPKPEPLPEPKPKPESKAPPSPTAKPAKAPPKPERRAPPVEEQGSPTGALAGMALGAPVARLDNPDFTYGYYVDQMLSLIARNWNRPPVGGGIEAWLHYRIQRDGTISAIEILRSSGINSFDLAALRAVQASSPLPPLPSGFRESSLGVNLIVR